MSNPNELEVLFEKKFIGAIEGQQGAKVKEIRGARNLDIQVRNKQIQYLWIDDW